MTPVDLETLRTIEAFLARTGFPPTRRELGEALGISAGAATVRIEKLVARGYLKRHSLVSRGLAVSEVPREVPGVAEVPGGVVFAVRACSRCGAARVALHPCGRCSTEPAAVPIASPPETT